MLQPGHFCSTEAEYPLSEKDLYPEHFEVFPSLQLFVYSLSQQYDLFSPSEQSEFTLRIWLMRTEGINLFSE